MPLGLMYMFMKDMQDRMRVLLNVFLVLLTMIFGSALSPNTDSDDGALHNTGNARLDRIMNSKSPSMIEREDRAYNDVIEMYDMVDSNEGIPIEQPEPIDGVTLPNFGPMDTER
jgi:hypothetical protein